MSESQQIQNHYIKSIVALLKNHKPSEQKETPITAAVMVLMLMSETEEIEIVITKRALTLPNYAGHYSLPGGIRDTDDANLYATATREVQEELNISPEAYKYIGQLDDLYDKDRNLVRPFICLMEKKEFTKLCKPSAHEISEIYLFSFSKGNQIIEDQELAAITQRRPSYSFTEGHVFIWGLTAAILNHFFSLLRQ